MPCSSFIQEALPEAVLPPGNQVSQDSIEKPVRGRRGPATVSGSDAAGMSLGMEKHPTGRRSGARNWSQENCLIDNHREEIWLRMVCSGAVSSNLRAMGMGIPHMLQTVWLRPDER